MLNLKISIKTKISAVIALSIVFVVIIMGSITISYQINHMKELENKILKDSVSAAATIAYTIMPYFIEKDFAAMNNLISYFSKRSDRAYLLVVDNNNRIMTHSLHAKTGGTFENPVTSKTEKINEGLIRKYVQAGKESIEISYPIKTGDLVLGTVILGLNTDWVQKEKNIIRKTIYASSGVSLAIILVGIMMGSAIADRIAQPILLLKQTAENVGKGDYNPTVYTKSRDEVGALAEAFNKMLEELKDAGAQLVDKKYVESIIANMNDALIVLSSEGRIKTVNKTTLNLLGYREDELIDQPFGMIYQDPDLQANGTFTATAGGLVSMEEKTLMSKEGRKIPALVSVAFMRGEGEPAGMVCVVKDITERKRFEEAKDRLLKAISAATEGIAITDDKDRFVYVNDAHARIYGCLQDELIGKSWRDTVTPELRPMIERNLSKTLHNRAVGIWSGEGLALRKDGTISPTEITATSRWDEMGNYLGHICIVRDITERKLAEDKIRQSEELIRSILNSVPQSIFWKDCNGVYLGCNETFAKTIAIGSPDQIVGKTDYDLPWPRAEADAYRADDQEVISRNQQKQHIIEPLQQADGSRLWIDTTKVPLTDATGTPFGVLGVYEDVSERKRSEEQIRSALTEKEILLKEIHHRVKNNLQIVASMLHLQAGYIKDRAARILFEESQKRVESMALLHEKLYRAKDLARIDFREYVDDLAGNLLALNTDKSERIEIKLDIEGIILDVNNSIPCGLIINELVSNALAHAFPYGRKGRIGISMRSGSGRKIGLIVSDNGIGFPEDIDFRNTVSLGMQLVNSLVSQLDGLIELDRSEGTSFNIEFQA